MATVHRLLLMVIMATSAFGSHDALVGQWRSKDAHETMEFTALGRVKCQTNGVAVRGRYELVEEGRLRLTFQGKDAPPAVEATYGITGHTMYFTTTNGKATEFVRVEKTRAAKKKSAEERAAKNREEDPVDEGKWEEFRIAGGQVVKCPVTDAGPLPARKGPYKVDAAGFALGQDDNGNGISLIFSFALAVERKGKPTRILVEDVSGETPATLVDDQSPSIEAKYWSGAAAPLPVSKDSLPWLFEKQPTIKVFRITVSAESGPDVVLYQPACYSSDVKARVALLAVDSH